MSTLYTKENFDALPDSTMMGTKRETWSLLAFEKGATALWILKILMAINTEMRIQAEALV